MSSSFVKAAVWAGIGFTLAPLFGLPLQAQDIAPPVPRDTLGVNAQVSTDFTAFATDTQLFLFVIINGREIGLVAEFMAHPDANRLSATRDELTQIGIKTPGQLSGRVYLDTIPGLRFDYDAEGQKISITAPPPALLPKVISAANRPGFLEAEKTTGAVLNYGLSADLSTASSGSGLRLSALTAALEGRVFSPLGTLNSTGVYRYGTAPGSTGSFVRHETAYEISSVDKALTFTFGDFTSSSQDWSRPIRMGGFQVRRDFGLRGDIVTEQLLSYSGAAAVPSTVDVFIDNNRTYSGNVDSGPFRIEDLPLYNGAGDAVIIVRDKQGREKRRQVSFFAAQNLIKKGMADYSLEVGFARQDFGGASDNYGSDPVVSGSLRYGLSEKVTLEGHFEGKSDLMMFGLGANFVPFNMAEISLTAGASTYQDTTAGFAHGTMRTSLRGVDINVSSLRAQDGFADLAAVTGLDYIAQSGGTTTGSLLEFPTALDVLSLSIPISRRGSKLGLNVVRAERDSSSDYIVSTSIGHSLGKGRGSISFHGSQNLTTSQTRMSLNMSMSLGNRTHLRSAATQNRDGTSNASLYVARPLGEKVGDYGYAAQLDTRAGRLHAGARGDYRTRYGKAGVEVQHSGGSTYVRGQFDGALVATAGTVVAGNTVKDSFAIVDVGVGDVPVYLQNRRVSRTNRKGRALVTGLSSNRSSRVSINVADLPIDATVGISAMEVIPARRSGTLVNFNGRQSASAIVVLRRPDGTVIPAGASATLKQGGEEFVVGYDGQAWLEGIKADNTVSVDTGTSTCTAHFKYRATDALQDIIDPVICK